jgi:ATP-dependent DNA helicase DinG
MNLTPKLKSLALHLKAMLTRVTEDEEVSEITSMAAKVAGLAEAVEAILSQKMEDAVYWIDKGRTVSLHAAPINVAEGLRRNLFEKVRSVVMTSATLWRGKQREEARERPRGNRRVGGYCGGE